MLQAFAQLCQHYDDNELFRCHADKLGHQHHDDVVQNAFQHMAAVVAPHRHLALRMVQRMQLPPPLQLVLAAVRPVADKIKQQQVDQQTDGSGVGHAGPELVQVQRAVTCRAQRAEDLVKPGSQGEKQHQAEQSEPVDQGVEDVRADAGPASGRIHGLHWTPALQGTENGQQDDDLDNAHHEPGSRAISVFKQAAHAKREQQRLHHGFEQPGLGVGENSGQPVHHVYFPEGCAAMPSWFSNQAW